MTGLRVHRLTSDDGAVLTAYVAGPSEGARRTIVLSHGWLLDHRSFLPVLRELDPSLRVVLWDQRGHGRSTLAGGSARVGRETVRALGADLRTVVDRLGGDEPVVLGGHSMGGMTIMAYAGLAPEEFSRRVRGVALVSTAAGGLHGTGRAGEAALMSLLRHVRRPIGHGLSENAHRASAFAPSAGNTEVHDATVIVRSTRCNVAAAYYDALMRHDERDSLRVLRDVPVRVLVGELDRLTPPLLTERMLQELPDARSAVVPGTGHMLPWEAPDRVAGALQELAG